MADHALKPDDPATPLWCECEKPLPVHLADRLDAQVDDLHILLAPVGEPERSLVDVVESFPDRGDGALAAPAGPPVPTPPSRRPCR